MKKDLKELFKHSYWGSEALEKKAISKILAIFKKYKNCSCKACGCNEWAEIYCEKHYGGGFYL